MGMTIAEKIIAAAAGVDSVKPGDIHTVTLDRMMSNDGTTHLTVDMYNNKLKNPRIADPKKLVFIVDHNVPSDSPKTAASFCSCVASSLKSTVIATPSSALLIIYWKLTSIEKNNPNRKIHADIVAMDASENILFLQIFLTPCFPTYPNVLILIYIPTFFLITDDYALLHSNDAFVHLVYDLLVMCNNKYCCSTLICLFQQTHDLP